MQISTPHHRSPPRPSPRRHRRRRRLRDVAAIGVESFSLSFNRSTNVLAPLLALLPPSFSGTRSLLVPLANRVGE